MSRLEIAELVVILALILAAVLACLVPAIRAQEAEPGAVKWRNKPREERLAIVAARKAAGVRPVHLPDGVTSFDAGNGVTCWLYERPCSLSCGDVRRVASLSCVRTAP